MRPFRLLAALALALGLAAFLLWALHRSSGPALAQTVTPPSLTRQDDPVVITGGLLYRLAGVPLDEIFVYAYHDTSLTQIPFQIDERLAGGMYVPIENSELGSDDELVFMAIDGGGWVDDPWLSAGGALISPTYVIAITDPISDTHAWAYLFRSAALSRTFTADYVSYDRGSDRITSPGRYSLGFSPSYGIRDYQTLGHSSTDLLDRDKLRLTGTFGFFQFSINEQNVTQVGVHAIDGPVRVTRVNTTTLTVLGFQIQGNATVFAYRSLFAQPAALESPSAIRITSLRLSTDWNDQAVGMTYYDANTPAGVTIDGIPDAITTTPATGWSQVAGVTGTVVTVLRIPAGVGGAQSTYYKDDSAMDSGDTGDRRSYGDAGIRVNNPNTGTYTLLGYTYFLTGSVGNVGSVYANYYDNPLQVSVAAPMRRVFLPVIMKR